MPRLAVAARGHICTARVPGRFRHGGRCCRCMGRLGVAGLPPGERLPLAPQMGDEGCQFLGCPGGLLILRSPEEVAHVHSLGYRGACHRLIRGWRPSLPNPRSDSGNDIRDSAADTWTKVQVPRYSPCGRVAGARRFDPGRVQRPRIARGTRKRCGLDLGPIPTRIAMHYTFRKPNACPAQGHCPAAVLKQVDSCNSAAAAALATRRSAAQTVEASDRLA